MTQPLLRNAATDLERLSLSGDLLVRGFGLSFSFIRQKAKAERKPES